MTTESPEEVAELIEHRKNRRPTNEELALAHRVELAALQGDKEVVGETKHTPTRERPFKLQGYGDRRALMTDANNVSVASFYRLDEARDVLRIINSHSALVSAARAELTHVTNQLFAHWRDDHGGNSADCAVCGMFEHRQERLANALSAGEEI